jgi:hypothetical protein
MTGSASSQSLAIVGTGFQTGATVKATYPGYSATLQVSSIATAEIQAAIDVGTTARAWSIQVVNPGGAASNAASLQVNAPPVAPAIASLAPNPMTGSAANQTLAIQGSGFQSGATVQASYTGYTATLPVSSVSASQIQATINVGTTARAWTLKVVNPGGLSSNAATLQVNAPPPAISTLTPNPMTGSAANQSLAIQGSGFQSGATVQASYPGYTATLQVSTITATQIQAVINVGTTARAWTVKVINPGNASSNAATLQVNAPPPPPAISALTPNPMTGSNAIQTIAIQGSGFQSGATVQAGYTGYTAILPVSALSATQIKAAIDVGVAARAWTVKVVNPNGQVSNIASLTVAAGH